MFSSFMLACVNFLSLFQSFEKSEVKCEFSTTLSQNFPAVLGFVDYDKPGV